MATTEYDTERAEAFAGRMLETLNAGAVAVMVSVGHRTGLFDALGDTGAATSQELADAAGLDERYVREWLGVMTTGRIVEYEPESGRYRLPAEHASWLTRAAAPDNLAVTAQWIPTLSTVEDDIVECFRKGGGVPYERYGRFHEVMAEESNQTVLSVLFTHILPLVPGMAETARGRRVAARSRLRARAGAPDAGRALSATARSRATTCPRDAIAYADCPGCRARRSRTSGSRLAISARSTSMPSPSRSRTSRRSTPSTTRRARSPCCVASSGR